MKEKKNCGKNEENITIKKKIKKILKGGRYFLCIDIFSYSFLSLILLLNYLFYLMLFFMYFLRLCLNARLFIWSFFFSKVLKSGCIDCCEM